MRSQDNNLPYEILTLSHLGFKYCSVYLKKILAYPFIYLRATCWKNTVIFSFLYVCKKVKFESCVSLEISRVYTYSCLRKSISEINLMLWIFKSLYFKLNSFLCAQSLEEKPIYLVRHTMGQTAPKRPETSFLECIPPDIEFYGFNTSIWVPLSPLGPQKSS